MSRVLIQHYLNDLATLRQVSGSHRESVVREAFKDLLKGWARSHELVFVPSTRSNRRRRSAAMSMVPCCTHCVWKAKVRAVRTATAGV